MEYLIVRNPKTLSLFDVIKAYFDTDEYFYVNKGLAFEEAQEVLGIVLMGDMLEQAKE